MEATEEGFKRDGLPDRRTGGKHCVALVSAPALVTGGVKEEVSVCVGVLQDKTENSSSFLLERTGCLGGLVGWFRSGDGKRGKRRDGREWLVP